MTKRQVISAIMFVLGMLVCVGAMGALDFGMYKVIAVEELHWATIRGLIGLALMGAAIPVSGECRGEVEEESEVDDDVNE